MYGDVPPFALAETLTLSPICTMSLFITDVFFSIDTGSVTVTLHVAISPLFDLAIIVAVPADLAVTVPFETVATLLLLVVHVTVLSVASEGVIVAVSVSVLPLFMVADVLFRLMPVTATVGFVTVTVQVAVLPLLVFAVIVAVPAALAVTVPFDTVAMLLLLVVHVTVLSVALEGVIVAVSVSELPVSRDRVDLSSSTESASTKRASTNVKPFAYAYSSATVFGIPETVKLLVL